MCVTATVYVVALSYTLPDSTAQREQTKALAVIDYFSHSSSCLFLFTSTQKLLTYAFAIYIMTSNVVVLLIAAVYT